MASNATFFENGAYGPLADLGAYRYLWSDNVNTGEGAGPIVYLSNSNNKESSAIIQNKCLYSTIESGWQTRMCWVFRRAFPMDQYKTIEITGSAYCYNGSSSQYNRITVGIANSNPPAVTNVKNLGYRWIFQSIKSINDDYGEQVIPSWSGTISVQLSNFNDVPLNGAPAYLQIGYYGVQSRTGGWISISKIIAKK